MGTNCAPLVAYLFLYCYESDFMDSLNHDNQADVINQADDTEAPFLDLHVHLSIANGFVFFFLKFMINAMTLILI